ncbi:hypothetical protein ACQEVZ_05340 [Dactylosporangium sp. CA-152071]|uniref:hypothetical protein n=1 Tax=Dactylosporangium sp. CA-152071 TaxID=3239933 RepID=UPI003D94336F
MSAAELNPGDAAQAPALVRDRQQQVLAVPPLPGWFWARACERSSPAPTPRSSPGPAWTVTGPAAPS